MQLLAAVLAWVFVAPALHPWLWALLQGALAMMTSLMLRQGRWVSISHAMVAPLVVGLIAAHLPSWLYLLAFALTASLSRNVLTERVPFYRSGREAADVLAREIADGKRVLDAGSGDGRLALRLALSRPDLDVTAMENAWGSHCLAWLRWLLAGKPGNFHPRCRNFWQDDWGAYDVLYVFLSPAPMAKVWEKFQQQGKSGGVLISNTFEIPGVVPLRSLPLSGPLQRVLLFWCRHHGTE